MATMIAALPERLAELEVGGVADTECEARLGGVWGLAAGNSLRSPLQPLGPRAGLGWLRRPAWPSQVAPCSCPARPAAGGGGSGGGRPVDVAADLGRLRGGGERDGASGRPRAA